MNQTLGPRNGVRHTGEFTYIFRNGQLIHKIKDTPLPDIDPRENKRFDNSIKALIAHEMRRGRKH